MRVPAFIAGSSEIGKCKSVLIFNKLYHPNEIEKNINQLRVTYYYHHNVYYKLKYSNVTI